MPAILEIFRTRKWLNSKNFTKCSLEFRKKFKTAQQVVTQFVTKYYIQPISVIPLLITFITVMCYLFRTGVLKV